MKRRIGWAEAIGHALACEGSVNLEDLAAAIAPGPRQRESIQALIEAAGEELNAGRAYIDPAALSAGSLVLVAAEA